MNPLESTPLGMTVADASRFTSLSQFEIRSAINANELPASRRGRRIVILRDDLEAFVRALPRVGQSA